MINDVRKTVMYILNKDNNGYITPDEFNLFAKQAQLEVFEQLFYDYTNWINKKNASLARDGYSNISKQIIDAIDIFNTADTLTYDAVNEAFDMPVDSYFLNTVLYNSKQVEEVLPHKVELLLQSNLTAPSISYPAYYQLGSQIKVYPSTIIADVKCRYIRYPKDPQWTYISLAATGSPVFNPTASGYQDFELPLSMFNDLVSKILSYCGVNIREFDVAQYAEKLDLNEQTKQS